MARVRCWLALALMFFPAKAAFSSERSAPVEFKNTRPGEFAWLLEFAGKPATAAMADPRFAVLEDHPLSILKAQFDLGDPPDGSTLVRDEILNSLKGRPDPIEAKLGRYAVLSGCNSAECTDRAFVWVDTARGVVLTVLVLPSTSNLPGTTPQMLIASRQLDVKRIEPAQLPERFWNDWHEWAYERRLPEVMTERVVNTYGGVSVIFHDDGSMCNDAFTTRDAEECGQKALDAATADLDALLAQVRTRLGPKSDDTAALDQGQMLWRAYRDSTCKAARQEFDGGTFAPVAEIGCERQMAHDRVRLLNGIYFTSLYD